MRRAVAGVVALGLAGAAAAPLLPRVALAATCSTPSVNSISVQAPGSGGAVLQQHGPGGSIVTLSGSGFTSIGCSTSVAVGGTGVSASVGSNTISFTAPQSGLGGVVQVSLHDSFGNTNIDQQQLVYVTDPTGSSLSNASPTAGSTVQFLGSNLDFHLGGAETLTAQYTWTAGALRGSPCPGVPAAAPTLADASHVNVPMPTQFCEGTVALMLKAPTSTASNNGSMSFVLDAGFDIAPHVSSLSGGGTAGGTETVNGSGFGGNFGTVTVNGTSASVSSWHDNAVAFVVPATASSGDVHLVRPLDGMGFDAGNLGVTASISDLSPSKAAVGDSVTVDGAGFGTQGGTVSVGSTQANVSSWTPTGITFTVPSGVTTAPVTVTTGSGTASPKTTPTLTVIPKITGITPSHATAGSLVEIDGTTFGTQQGTVQIGGESAQVTLWGDSSVLVVVPSTASPGSTTVVLTPPGTNAASAGFTVDVPAAPTAAPSSGHPGSSSTPGVPGTSPTPGLIPPNPSGPIITTGPVPFVKPKPAPGPVNLTLTSVAGQADPGNTVKFTVTLMAFGKPLVGAPVDLLMVIEPGQDAAIDPAHAVTDANGQVSGVIHLSRTPGDHIVLARSGIYSDEIRVVGRSATAAVAAGNRQPGSGDPAAAGTSLLAIRSPVLWALIACMLLFGVGFGLNLVTAPAGGAVARVAVGGEVVAGRAGLRASLREVAVLAGEAARFSAAVVAILGAQALGRVRARRS